MKKSFRLVLAVCTVAALTGLRYKIADTRPQVRSVLRKCASLVAPSSVYAQGVTVLWSADMESTGNPGENLQQWYLPDCCDRSELNPPQTSSNGGGAYNSGIASAGASFDYAHGGTYSAMLKINTTVESGTRLFRWLEPRINNSNSDLYYSAWFYFPQNYTPAVYWNIVQWKSASPTQGDGVMYNVEVNNRGSGMYLYLCPPAFVTGGCYGQTGSTYYIPVGTWTHVEAHYVGAGNNAGHVTIWEDGNQLFDFANVQTRYSDGDLAWSVNNYSNGLTPSPATIYVDDAKICQGGRCP